MFSVLGFACLSLKWSLIYSYNVAVMEYAVNVDTSQSTEVILADNTANYIRLIAEVTSNQTEGLDLIIFPESTLLPYVAPHSQYSAKLPKSSDEVLCNSTDNTYPTYLKNLSCAAVNYQVVVVINLTEEDEDLFYNTDVIIGTKGTVLARYRKYNLFGEYGITRPSTLDLPIVQIQNHTFGIMTCFDIMFATPLINLTKMGVQNVIFPLSWISELPYLTALQVQQMWAQEFDVVLLASGASRPQAGAGGAGVFYGTKGPLVSNMSPSIRTRVMVQQIPPSQSVVEEYIDESYDDFYMLVDPSMKDHTSEVLDKTSSSTQIRLYLENGAYSLSCDFNISTEYTPNQTSPSYTYHMVAYTGVRSYSGLYYGGIETCAVVACLNASVTSCGHRFKNNDVSWPITFKSLSVTGTFIKSDQRIQLPSTLLSSMHPLPVEHYDWMKEESGEDVLRTVRLTHAQNKLMTFGIFGRVFDRDWDPVERSMSNIASSSKCLVILLILLTQCFTK